MISLTVEAVVFDLDATLVNLGGFVNWREGQKQVVGAYLECGCTDELIKRCREKGLFDMLNIMWDELCSTMPKEEAERIQDKAYCALDACEADAVNQSQLMPGCIEALEWLKNNSIKMGIATSNSQEVVERVLELRGLRGYFSAVVGRTLKLRMKPHPDQITACFMRLGTDPKKGAVVGDSARDVRAAKAAGAYAIAVPASFTRRKTLEEAGADTIIESLCELPRTIQNLRQ